MAVAAALLVAAGMLFVPLPADPLEGTFLTPDSPDWLAAGLAFAGYESVHNDRPPLLPAVYALLYLAGWERLVSLFHPAVFLLAAAAAAMLARRTSDHPLAPPAAALLVLLLGKLGFQAHFLMADLLAASLSALAAAALANLRRDPAAAWSFAAFFVAAQAAQNVLPLLLPAFLLYLVVERDSFPRRSLVVAVTILAVTPLLLAAAHVAIARSAGTEAYNLHVGYLGFLGSSGLRFYPVAALGLFGPLLPLAMAGTSSRSGLDRGARVLLAGSVAAVFVFFGVFYEWLTVRFLTYAAIPLAVLAAAPVSRLLAGRRWWLGAALLGAHGVYGNLGHVDAYWPAVPFAPGTGIVAEMERRDPAFVQPWRLRTGTASIDWIPKLLMRPEEIPPGVIDHLAFDRGATAELARLGRGLRPAPGVTGLLDPLHGVTNRYVLSVALRGPVVAFEPADAAIRLAVVRRGASIPSGFAVVSEGERFVLLSRRSAGTAFGLRSGEGEPTRAAKRR